MEYLTYRIDWNNNEMQLIDCSPLFSMNPQETVPISLSIHAMKTLVKMERPGLTEDEYRFLLDVHSKKGIVTVNLRRSPYNFMLHPPYDILEHVLRQSLTRRETEIAIMMFEANTIRSVASQLHIAEGTVKRIIYNIYQKLNVASQVELIREVYQRLADAQTAALEPSAQEAAE